MTVLSRFSRRRILAATGACASLVAVSRAAAAADTLRRTPTQVLGPFYPLDKPLDDDADLTSVKGRRGRAAGQVIHVMGRVLNVAGAPVKGATIEVWQANSHGRYTHPGDHNTAPLDPNFEGYARLTTDAAGRYRFKTIKPAAYPAGSFMRPAHIHFDVAGKVNRLITQMYFPGDPFNEDDLVMAIATDYKKLLVADMGPPTADLEADSLIARWDIVLENG
jgi:protocatechuate 3,4-dioxygenase beta subunit